MSPRKRSEIELEAPAADDGRRQRSARLAGVPVRPDPALRRVLGEHPPGTWIELTTTVEVPPAHRRVVLGAGTVALVMQHNGEYAMVRIGGHPFALARTLTVTLTE